MARPKFKARRTTNRERGQTMLLVVLGLGIFLLGAMAFAIDLSHLWFNRQAAQTAADAACTAGAMDMLADVNVGGTHGGFTPAAANTYDCNNSTTATYAPCQYAIKNGFNSSISSTSAGNGNLGNNVSFDFPASGSISAPPGVNAPSSTQAPVPFIRVTVTNNIPTFFAGLLKGLTKQTIKAYAVCGLQSNIAPIPILVLHPTNQQSLSVQGTPAINIIGGPTQSIQVNSCSTSNNPGSGCGTNDAANTGGGGDINLCAGGNNFCGSNMGVFGPEAVPGGFQTSCAANRPAGAPACASQLTPQWNSPQSPISDPFANTVAPKLTDFPGGSASTPYVPADLCGPNLRRIDGSACTAAQINSNNGSGAVCSGSDIAAGNCLVDYKVHGCSDSSANAVGVAPTNNNSCVLFTPGYYPNGILSKGGVSVFDPGLYYLNKIPSGGGAGACAGFDFCAASNSFLRPSLYTGGYANGAGGVTVPTWYSYNDGTNVDGGTVFYFGDNGSVNMDSNSGKTKAGSGKGTIAPDPFGSTAWQQSGATLNSLVTCPNGGTVPNPVLPNSIGGNILFAPCSLSGTWGDPGSSPYAQFRGILFFQNRSNSASSTDGASWGGGGQFLLAGTMYIHQCVVGTAGTADTGTGCTTQPPNQAFHMQLTLQGNSASGTYVLGEIITDQLQLGGTSGINMQLNPNSAFNILKVSLLQ